MQRMYVMFQLPWERDSLSEGHAQYCTDRPITVGLALPIQGRNILFNGIGVTSKTKTIYRLIVLMD